MALDITRLYHRDDPIMLGAPPGKPPHDYSYMRTVMKSAMIHDELAATGVPGVEAVWTHEAGGGRLFITVSLKQRYAGQARQVAHLTSQLPAAAYMNRYVVVVDDDIAPRSLDEVIWAISTRSDPAEDIEIMRRTWGSRLDPMLVPGTPPHNSRAIVDACRPYERGDDFARVVRSDPAYLADVRRKWETALSGDA